MANTASDFLDTLEKRMPFPVKAIQVGGSEFEAVFEEAFQRRGIKKKIEKERACVTNHMNEHTILRCSLSCVSIIYQWRC